MRILQKFLAIISIPLAFEILFVAVLLILVSQEDAEVMQQIRSQIVKSTVEKVIGSGDECAILLAEYGYTRDPEALRKFLSVRKTSLKWIEEMESTIEKSDPRQLVAVRQIRDAWVEFGDLLDKIKGWAGASTTADMQIMSLLTIKEKIASGNEAIQDLYRYQNALDEEIKQRHRDTRLYLHLWLTLGIVANIIFVFFMVIFCRDITSRINALKDNSIRLSTGQELVKSQGGEDEIAEFDGIFYDVATALQDAYDRERSNFDGAADAVCALDSKGLITRANEAFQRVMGAKSSEILDCQFSRFIDEDSQECLSRVLNAVKQPGAQRQELEVKMLTAGDKWRNVLWSLVWEPEFQLYMCVGRDVTAYKQLENARQDFVAMLSHDLRSPLSSIGATFELCESGAYGELNPKMSALVDRALSSVRRLISLIGELLDLEKIEAGEMDLNLETVAVSRVIEQSVHAVSAGAAAEKKVLKSWSGDLVLYADENRIVRVLINLLSNAIKYSEPGGVVSIDAELLDEGVKISVSDQGSGIPEEHFENIFERYKQVSRLDHSVKRGSGLGLSICKAIVEAHGGAIGVNSTVGKGSTFWFILPDDPPDQHHTR